MASALFRARHAAGIITVDSAMADLNVWLRAGMEALCGYRYARFRSGE